MINKPLYISFQANDIHAHIVTCEENGFAIDDGMIEEIEKMTNSSSDYWYMLDKKYLISCIICVFVNRYQPKKH